MQGAGLALEGGGDAAVIVDRQDSARDERKGRPGGEAEDRRARAGMSAP